MKFLNKKEIIVVIGISIMILLIILNPPMAFWERDGTLAERDVINAICYNLDSVELCKDTVSVGSSTGECAWNQELNKCVGTNFQTG